MKILHIIEALGGGVHTYFKDLSYFFSQKEVLNDYETIIVYNDKRDEIVPEKIKEDFGDKVKLIKVDMVKNLNPIKDLISTYELAKVIRKVNPDVIHLHSSKASVIGRWASFVSFKKHKLFYTPHGYSFLRKDISSSKQNLYRIIEKYTQSIFGGTTIACGDTEYEIAKKLGKATLVRNGINLKKVERNYIAINNSQLTLGLVGRISEQKNPKLFNQIAFHFPQYKFIWIGDGELRHEITAPNIEVTGWFFNSEEVYKHLNRIDVILQTSLWEGLPIALLEGLAFHKPIVATDVIGNKDIVDHRINGYLFTKIEELDEYFTLLEQAEAREKMGKNAYLSCKNKFDSQKNFYDLINIYEN
ncbi:glycosyltransferase [Empedobacter stercoris]|uniref:glycosyltransferase n=1 Tax=Empedobacter stercoris TaxID=1628248 RepID=UPI0039E73B23